MPELAELAPNGRPADGRQPAHQRRRAAARPARCRTSAPTRWTCPRPARSTPKTRACSASSCVTSSRSTTSSATSGSSAPTKRCRTCSARSSRSPTGSGRPGRRRATSSSRPHGRVLDSMLSEHQCEGWLEGYLLTGRHGLFNCYEAFIHIVDSMFNQHAKWLEGHRAAAVAARHRLAELPARLARLAAGPQRLHPPGPRLPRPRRQQEGRHRPGLPAAGRQLPAVGFDHCLRSRHYVNVVVAGKRAMPQWLTMDAAAVHCTEGIGIWQWASNDQGAEPDVVLACCGDTPDPGGPGRRVDPARAPARAEDPRGQRRRPDEAAASHRAPARAQRRATTTPLFTTDKHIIFAFHGYPWLIHRLTYRRTNRNLHVRG